MNNGEFGRTMYDIYYSFDDKSSVLQLIDPKPTTSDMRELVEIILDHSSHYVRN